jgi:hypothetical protein
MWGALFVEKPRRGTYQLKPAARASPSEPAQPEKTLNLKTLFPETPLGRKDDAAPAGTVIPADANPGVLPILI